MQSEPANVEIALTPQFQKDLRNLAKAYRTIRSDLQPLIDQLQRGETSGDRISGVHHFVFKVRLKNTNIHKGKSAGYRVIDYLKTSHHIILVTIYSKSNYSDISRKMIEGIITQYEQQP